MPSTFGTENQFFVSTIPSLQAKVGYQYLSTLEHAFAVRAYEGFEREECGRVLLQVVGVLRDA
ncbi:hypothetical protein PENPOL_c008G00796 [Penicillium polonicum]|uniref:Uncharacterized protein n=1 Tax=Penicillium polonicum TaxID=60169 RepID=A0A1V6NGP1_PENPO|nr:hypothetical protein PENPOL_c008G00796 [Penicillium polonicum]